MCNYRKALQQLNVDDPLLTPNAYMWAIVTKDKLRNTLRKGPKYREPQHISWNQTFRWRVIAE